MDVLPLATITLPTTVPSAQATWQEWDVYLRRVALYNDNILRQQQIAASQAHGKAQADTAVAMADHVAVQKQLIEAMNAPIPSAKRSKADLVIEFLKAHPQSTAATDLQDVDAVIKRVDAFYNRFPNG